MIDPIKAAFLSLIVHLHAQGTHCAPPGVVWDTNYIVNVCQAEASPLDVAESCYNLKERLIILPDGPLNLTLLYHEMARHIYQICLGEVFTEAEPFEVLAAERWARQ